MARRHGARVHESAKPDGETGVAKLGGTGFPDPPVLDSVSLCIGAHNFPACSTVLGMPTLLSLFTGAGGFDLGLEAAGFRVVGCVEVDSDCRQTLEMNRPQWPLASPGNVHYYQSDELLSEFGLVAGEVTAVVGGPPCQPWSKSAYWRTGDSKRFLDPRADTLRAFMSIVAAALPEVVVLENVRGFGYRGKDEAVRFVKDQLDEINRRNRTHYRLSVFAINAADYGVPQLRERLFLVAAREGFEIEPPTPTHGVGRENPRTTAWDAIGDLDDGAAWPEDLSPSGKWAALLPSIPEGRNYLWHTPRGGGKSLFGWRTRYWSFLLKLAKNRPSWTLQAQPGPATGPFHWKSRHLSAMEMTRLQTFPVGYELAGGYRSVRRQLGNAVPSAIGELIGRELLLHLRSHRHEAPLTLIPGHRIDCPEPETTRPLPAQYRDLVSYREEHPGPGRGPGARQQ